MKIILFLSIMVFSISSIEILAQDTTGKTFSKNGYQAWITTTDNNVFRGLLWMVSEDTVYFTSDLEKNWKKPQAATKIFKQPVTEIESIRTKRVHAVWKGYGYGVLTGVTVGAIGVLILDVNEEQDPILAIPLGGFLGSGIGIIAGFMPGMTFGINGVQKKWNFHLPELDMRAFWRQSK